MDGSELLTEPGGVSTAQYASYHFEQFYDYSLKEYARWNRKYSYYYGDLLPANRSARILDLGCGGGRFLHFLKSVGYSNLAGVDADAKQLAALRKTLTCDTYEAGILDLLHSSSGQYDFISCHHVIEHLSRDDSNHLLRLAYQALSPGGRLIVSTPNGARPWMGWHMFADLSHDHLYTSSSLREVMEMAGFRDVMLRPEGPVPYSVLSALRWLLWKGWREPYLKLCFAIENGLGPLNGAKLIVSAGIIAAGVKPR